MGAIELLIKITKVIDDCEVVLNDLEDTKELIRFNEIHLEAKEYIRVNHTEKIGSKSIHYKASTENTFIE